MQGSHVSLDQPGRGDEALCAAELDSGEIDSEHLQPVIGEQAGRRHARAAAEIHDPASRT